MNLSLDRPIAFIDLETTGLNPSFDRIVELSALKVHPDGSEEVKSVRVNPEMPISAGATRVHGINDADVGREPTFRQYAKNLLAFLDGCDLSGFNAIRFDLPMLRAELARVGMKLDLDNRKVVDSMVIFHQMEPRNLGAAYSKYCVKPWTRPHIPLPATSGLRWRSLTPRSSTILNSAAPWRHSMTFVIQESRTGSMMKGN